MGAVSAKDIADAFLRAEGAVKSTVSAIKSGTVGVGIDVANDPASPELVCRLRQLYAIKYNQPIPNCPKAILRGDDSALADALPAVRAFVYVKKYPVLLPVGLAAVLGIPFLLGYLAGRK